MLCQPTCCKPWRTKLKTHREWGVQEIRTWPVREYYRSLQSEILSFTAQLCNSTVLTAEGEWEMKVGLWSDWMKICEARSLFKSTALASCKTRRNLHSQGAARRRKGAKRSTVCPVKLSLCLTKHHAMKAYWGSEGIAPHTFFDLGTRWRWIVSFTLRLLYPQGKRLWYPLDRRLGGPQSRSGRGGEEKVASPHLDSNFDHPIVQPVVSRYIDWAMPALGKCWCLFITLECIDPPAAC
jgi:hypothetical protein